jgi:hypothetical protein
LQAAVSSLKSKLKKTHFLIIICCVLVTFPATVEAQNSPNATEQPMTAAILAHEMTESEAQILSANHFTVEADVNFDPSSNWTAIYNIAKKYNIPLIGKIDHITVNDNFTLQDWNQSVQKAVNDYGDVTRVWEIWNEPTFPMNWKGYFNGSASTYTDMLKAAWQIIHTSQPDATVIAFGGLHLFSSIDPYWYDTWVMRGQQFALNVTALGGMDFCDAIGLHAYPWGLNYSGLVENLFINSLNSYRQITGGKDVWITETGQTSGQYGRNQTDKATYLNQTFAFFGSLGVKGYVWYELNDDNGRVAAEGSFGLFDVDGAATPAWNVYSNIAYTQYVIPETSPTLVLALSVIVVTVGMAMKRKSCGYSKIEIAKH